NVKKLVYLGSSCVYSDNSPQPIKEEYLLTNSLHPSNEGYALAKILGIRLCAYYQKEHNRDFIAVLPSNLYGPNDNYDSENSHVIAALIHRFHEVKELNLPQTIVWGTGEPIREFTYTDDFSQALIIAMQKYSDNIHLNIGSGQETVIKDLVHLVAQEVGYTGKIVFDTSKPNGSMRKILDNSKIKSLGWTTKTSLQAGLKLTYQDYLQNLSNNQLYKRSLLK
ncbi:MAG: NAD-dependent epimerase/dehydratase family protein, partial [Brevinema sp.]